MLFAAEAGSTMFKDRTDAAATKPKNRANPPATAAAWWLLLGGGSDDAARKDDEVTRPTASTW